MTFFGSGKVELAWFGPRIGGAGTGTEAAPVAMLALAASSDSGITRGDLAAALTSIGASSRETTFFTGGAAEDLSSSVDSRGAESVVSFCGWTLMGLVAALMVATPPFDALGAPPRNAKLAPTTTKMVAMAAPVTNSGLRDRGGGGGAIGACASGATPEVSAQSSNSADGWKVSGCGCCSAGSALAQQRPQIREIDEIVLFGRRFDLDGGRGGLRVHEAGRLRLGGCGLRGVSEDRGQRIAVAVAPGDEPRQFSQRILVVRRRIGRAQAAFEFLDVDGATFRQCAHIPTSQATPAGPLS